MLQNALNYSHQLLKEVLHEGDSAIDATIGNGNDTLLMAELVGETGNVYGFDIQELALQNTRKKLLDAQVKANVELFLTGHEQLDEVIPKEEKIKACMFNLGYLPKSDKHIITLPQTTLTALDAALERLLPGGRVIIVAYYGHAGGEEELAAVKEYCGGLLQEEFAVVCYQFLNQRNSPPVLICVEKK